MIKNIKYKNIHKIPVRKIRSKIDSVFSFSENEKHIIINDSLMQSNKNIPISQR
jgi:hypothetical protein